MIRALSNYSRDTTFNQAIVLAKEYQKASREDFVTLFGRAFEKSILTGNWLRSLPLVRCGGGLIIIQPMRMYYQSY